MATKISGFEWKAFYSDERVWTPGAWHEGEVLMGDDGIDYSCNTDNVPADVTVTLDGGLWYKDDNTTQDKALDFEKVFKKWRNAQKNEYLVVESPKECHEQLCAFLKTIGAKIR